MEDTLDRVNAEEYLLNIPMWTKKKNSLEDVKQFLKELGDPQRKLKIIHVAGTNGKGSVCAFLTSLLGELGYHTASFVSPHLVEVRERLLLDGEIISRESFAQCFRQVYEVGQRMAKQGYCHPTFFEFLFYIQLVMAENEQVDWLVMETGLGGRLDTTNAIENPRAVVITSISMDHMQYLGDTITLIAGEKAGIIKEGIPVVYDDGQPEASSVIRQQAEVLHAPLLPVSQDDYEVTRWTESGVAVHTRDGMDLSIPFPADYQAVNALLAVRTLELLLREERRNAGESQEEWERNMAAGILKTSWPGRMEQVLPGIYLDGAHNEGGIRAFGRNVRRIQDISGKKVHILFAVVADKAYDKMINCLTEAISPEAVTLAHMESERALDIDTLAEAFRKQVLCPVYGYGSVKEAVEAAMERKRPDELLFCVGSLYLIGEIKDVLRRNTI